MERKSADWAFARYQSLRARLPRAGFPASSERVPSLSALAERFDLFLLDAFGVLNVGEGAIPSAPAAMAALQAAGKRLMVLTNGATLPASAALEKYRRLGFDFSPEDVIASRDALACALADMPLGRQWGAMAARMSRLDALPAECHLLGDDAAVYASVDGFLLLSTVEWPPERTALLQAALAERPRPVLVGNPDIVAPREDGLSVEPGHIGHLLADLRGVAPRFFGKPYGDVYDMALARAGGVAPERVLMVGDTLHTDILGGAAAGVKTALVTDHGLFAGRDVAPFIKESGIVPDYILPSP